MAVQSRAHPWQGRLRENAPGENPPAHKTCSKCGETKPLAEFARDYRCHQGRRSVCRPCDAAAHRAYRLAHPERYREYARARRANGARRAAERRRYDATHPRPPAHWWPLVRAAMEANRAVSTIRNHIVVGRIKAIRYGRNVYVDPADVQRLAEWGKQNRKLTADKVRAILAAVRGGEPQKAIARRYGITQGTVSAIYRGEIWRSVTREEA